MGVKKIIFIYPHINSIGGVELAIHRLSAKIKNNFDIYVGFRQYDSDINMLFKISENATVINIDHHKHQTFDVCIYCSLYSPTYVKATKYIRWVHGCVTDMRYRMKPEPEISTYVAVGKVCADQITQQLPDVKPETIFNELDKDIFEKSEQPVNIKKEKLTLVTVSRISPEKGFERMLKVSQQLPKDYIWHIVGSGYNKAYEAKIKKLAPKQWIFHGNQDNPFPYIKQADYLLQLSDYEAFGYVLQEALTLGTPVITTDYLSSSEMVDHGKNGWIIKKDLSDFDPEILTFNYCKRVYPSPVNAEI